MTMYQRKLCKNTIAHKLAGTSGIKFSSGSKMTLIKFSVILRNKWINPTQAKELNYKQENNLLPIWFFHSSRSQSESEDYYDVAR